MATTKTRSMESMSDSFALSPFSRTLVLSLPGFGQQRHQPRLTRTVLQQGFSFLGSRSGSARAPKARPPNPEFVKHGAEERQAQTDNIVVITLDSGDERAAEAINSEPAGHV